MKPFAKAAILAAVALSTLSCGKKLSVTVETPPQDLDASEVTRVTNEIYTAINEIGIFLDIDAKLPKIKVVFIPEGQTSCTIDGYFTVVEDFARLHWSPVWYDATFFLDLYGKNYRYGGGSRPGSRFFIEGVAILFQQVYGKDRQFPFFDLDYEESLKAYNGEFDPTEVLMTNAAVFDAFNTRERAVAYTQAGSFMIYLFKTYGATKLRTLYRSGGPDFEGVYGKSINELDSEWRTFNQIDR